MSQHFHRCPRCKELWICELRSCQALPAHTCPRCFLGQLYDTAAGELGRLHTRADCVTWSLAGVAVLLAVLAATWG
jgi:hypothetical protein